MSLIQAAEDIKSLAAKFKSIISVSEALEKVGSIEQAEHEALARKQKAYAAADEAIKALSARKADLEEFEKQCALKHKEHEAVVAQQESKAAAIVDEATKRSLSIFSAAKLEKASLEMKNAAARKELLAIQADVDAKAKELSVLQGNLKEVKAKISAFVG